MSTLSDTTTLFSVKGVVAVVTGGATGAQIGQLVSKMAGLEANPRSAMLP